MDIFMDPTLIGALITLTALEIILGIDNIVFISILAGKLPVHQQGKARKIGLVAAMMTRIALLFSLSFIMSLTAPVFSVPVLDHAVSVRDLILLLGGLFLLYKSVKEIHEKVEGDTAENERSMKVRTTMAATIVQIMLIDIVFSLDSVITAVGMVNNLPVMVAAILISVGIMMLASGAVSDFIARHPSIKLLALSFLLLIGVLLVAEGCGLNVPKGYVYFAMGFSFLVQMLNIRMSRKAKEATQEQVNDSDR
ncbi:MAG: TerC family protein [Candidatus Melainabacteria bacterium]|nr:TerC family protein [Candidatus Melainabacteria bacterium]